MYAFSIIADPPIVTLRLGSTLSDDIKEGDDVYFECQAVANPQWRKLYWLHDVSIKSNATNIQLEAFRLFYRIFVFITFITSNFIGAREKHINPNVKILSEQNKKCRVCNV